MVLADVARSRRLVWTGAAARHRAVRPPRPWPLMVIALGAGVALWGGWVDLGKLTGFGLVTPLPGIADGFEIDTSIVLPLGVEAYAAYALKVWLTSAALSRRTKQFAGWSVVASLFIGWCAQGASHLMTSYGITRAPWQVTVLVSMVPVLALGLATGLAQLVAQDTHRTSTAGGPGGMAPELVPSLPPLVLRLVIPDHLVHQAITSPPPAPPAEAPASPAQPPAVVAVRPALASRLALLTNADRQISGPVSSLDLQDTSPGLQDTGINLPLAVLEKARELITTSEEAGDPIGRPALMRELNALGPVRVSEHNARRLLKEFSTRPRQTSRREAVSA